MIFLKCGSKQLQICVCQCQCVFIFLAFLLCIQHTIFVVHTIYITLYQNSGVCTLIYKIIIAYICVCMCVLVVCL